MKCLSLNKDQKNVFALLKILPMLTISKEVDKGLWRGSGELQKLVSSYDCHGASHCNLIMILPSTHRHLSSQTRFPNADLKRNTNSVNLHSPDQAQQYLGPLSKSQ